MLDRIRSWNSDSKWWHYTYLVDWVTTILLLVIAVVVSDIKPACESFSPTDPTISHPFSTSPAFPSWTLPFLSWIGPCVLAAAIVGLLHWFTPKDPASPSCAGSHPVVTGAGAYNAVHDAHHVLLAITQGVVVAMLITDSIKNAAGRHRPDFIDRLRRELDFDPLNPFPGYAEAVCNSSNHDIHDGMRSFPSGHSSLAFAGWTVLGLFLSARLQYTSTPNACSFYKLVCVVFITGSVPTAVALSRTHDYRHNYSDIFAGACIGILSGFLCFNLHHALSSKLPKNRKTPPESEEML
ncbi:hypothetical protein DIPPA_18581 [Diplonema papillatum]|nr:hypothetical protein DIPPA_18581 [Diplonema papillatum]